MTSEQEINNARQGKNDAQQGRNNAEQVGQNLAQDITNDAQHDTNKEQKRTNTAQGVTNTRQGTTNDAQGVTNDAQKRTNDAQGVTNDEMRVQLDKLQAGTNTAQAGTNTAQAGTNSDQHATNEVQADTNAAQADTNNVQAGTNSGVQDQIDSIRATSMTVQDVVLALTESLRVNTASLLAVSDDLKSNLKMYRQIDMRITKVESYAEKIEVMGNRRAKTFRRLWKLAVVVAVTLSLLLSSAFYFVSATAAQRACVDRNASQARVTNLIQQFYDIGQSQPGGAGASAAVEKKYLDNAPAPAHCGLVP